MDVRDRNRPVERNDRRAIGFDQQVVEGEDASPIRFFVAPSGAETASNTGLEMKFTDFFSGRGQIQMEKTTPNHGFVPKGSILLRQQ